MNSSVWVNVRKSGRTFIKCKHFFKTYCTSSEEVVLPKKIKRGPTDILRALANTIPRDPTAAHYKYHDDPYLIPYSNFSKRSYALAQEAGRKAAYWIRQEHADLFQHKVADPPIEAFIPKPVFDENSTIDEKELEKAIKNVWISDAVNIYNILKKKGIETSRDSKQSLLELLCFYNGDDPIKEDWIEERWFRLDSLSRTVPKKTWKDNCLAEEIFRELKPHDSLSYSALISGMATYGELDRAWQLYQNSTEENIPINVTAFNSLISRVKFLKESHELMWRLVEDLLNEMNKRGLAPNLGTLNAVLETLSNMSTNRNAKEYALRTIAEFKQLGIKPCLGSYYFLLNIFCKDNNQRSSILQNIMNELEGNPLEVRHAKATSFFTRAMDVCRNHLRDKNMAYRVNNLLHTADNYNLIGDSYQESHYYRYFFFLLCETESIEGLMKNYNSLVPNVYIPEPTVMLEILNAVEMNAAWDLLPKLFSDMFVFDHLDRSNLVEKVLHCCATVLDEDLSEQINKIGSQVWEKLEGQQRERNAVEWTGKMLSDLLMTFLNTKDKEKATLVFHKLSKSQNTYIGEPEILPLQLFLDACIADGSTDLALKCISYCHDIGFLETENMAKRLNSSVELSASQKAFLENTVGKEVLERKAKASQ